MSSDAEILEAALAQFADTGVRRTSIDDIAQRAGINRVTLYRRFGSREQIVHAAYLQEAARVLGLIDAEAGLIPTPDSPEAAGFDPAAWITRFFSAAVRELRANPVLKQMLAVDREAILTAMTLDAGDALGLAATTSAANIRALRAHADDPLPDDDVDLLAATFARIAQSLVLTPDGPPALTSPKALRQYAERVVVPLVLGRN